MKMATNGLTTLAAANMVPADWQSIVLRPQLDGTTLPGPQRHSRALSVGTQEQESAKKPVFDVSWKDWQEQMLCRVANAGLQSHIR